MEKKIEDKSNKKRGYTIEVPPEDRKELSRIGSIKEFKPHPYVPSFLPWFDVNPVIRYDPAKEFLLGIDLAADPDRLNIQVKRKHNKPKFNFNN